VREGDKSSTMHYDADAQRWVGGDDVSLDGFDDSDGGDGDDEVEKGDDYDAEITDRCADDHDYVTVDLELEQVEHLYKSDSVIIQRLDSDLYSTTELQLDKEQSDRIDCIRQNISGSRNIEKNNDVIVRENVERSTSSNEPILRKKSLLTGRFLYIYIAFIIFIIINFGLIARTYFHIITMN